MDLPLPSLPRDMSFPEPLFCCAKAVSINTPNSTKLHNDPNRDIHDAIFNSFMNFAYRRQTAATLMVRILGILPPFSEYLWEYRDEDASYRCSWNIRATSAMSEDVILTPKPWIVAHPRYRSRIIHTISIGVVSQQHQFHSTTVANTDSDSRDTPKQPYHPKHTICHPPHVSARFRSRLLAPILRTPIKLAIWLDRSESRALVCGGKRVQVEGGEVGCEVRSRFQVLSPNVEAESCYEISSRWTAVSGSSGKLMDSAEWWRGCGETTFRSSELLVMIYNAGFRPAFI